MHRNPEPLFHASKRANNMRKSEMPAVPGAVTGPYHVIEGAECNGATAKALLVRVPGLDRPTWVPRSQVDPTCTVPMLGRPGPLRVTVWWASRRGFR